MPRPTGNRPTEHELSILMILWRKSPLSIAEILEQFSKHPAPAYSSILTAVRLMEKKGYIRHSKEGKAFLYSPVLKQERYQRTELKKITDRFFGGSAFALAVNLVKDESLNATERAQLKKILENL